MQEKNPNQKQLMDQSMAHPTAEEATHAQSRLLLHFPACAFSGCQSLTIFRKRDRDRQREDGYCTGD
jgi:hypothetical protein